MDFSVFVNSSLDNKLWLEFGPFGGIALQNWPICPSSLNAQSCRVQVDGNVQSFDARPEKLFGGGFQVYVISSQDSNLWLEYGPFGGFDPQNWPTCTPGSPNPASCRVLVDGNVGYNLRRPPLWFLDHAFVQSSLDNNLWLEYAPFGTMPPVPCFAPNTNVQQFGCRILIDANVESFEVGGVAAWTLVSL